MSAAESAAAPPRLPLGQALIVTLGVVVAIAGFVALGAWLHVVPLYAGFLLLWVWSALHELSLKALPAALAGALTGAALSFTLQTGAAMASPVLIMAALLLMIGAVFLVVAGRAALVCNQSTMLFITVLNAPLLQAGRGFSRCDRGDCTRRWVVRRDCLGPWPDCIGALQAQHVDLAVTLGTGS